MVRMELTDVFAGFARRPIEAAKRLPALTSEQLNAHPAGHPNSVAWLLWHTGREVDVQLSHLSGRAQQWDAYRDRFALGDLGDSVGYGHSVDQAAQIKVADQQLVTDYLDATLAALVDYVSGLSGSEFDEVIDQNWEPPVTRGVRLVSIIDDAAQHVGQAAYAAGALT